MDNVFAAIIVGIEQTLRTKTSFAIERQGQDQLRLHNFQGTIVVSTLSAGLHILKIGYADQDCLLDYADPELFNNILSKVQYLQDIEHHLRNQKIREERFKLTPRQS
jgi:hypothetical protein